MVDENPGWAGDPLRREALDVFDSVMGCVEEELAYQMKAFIVRDVRSGLLGEGFAVDILDVVVRNGCFGTIGIEELAYVTYKGLNDHWRNGCADRCSVERHVDMCSLLVVVLAGKLGCCCSPLYACDIE